MLNIPTKTLEALAKILNDKFDTSSFIEYLSEDEAGAMFLNELKEDYLREQRIPTFSEIEDKAWDIVAIVYAPWVTVADMFFAKFGGETYTDAKSFAFTDTKTFYGFMMGLIGKAIKIDVKLKEEPREGENNMERREQVSILASNLSEEDLAKMVQELDSPEVAELIAYQNDESFFDKFYSDKPYKAVLDTSLGVWDQKDDLVVFASTGYLNSYSESEYKSLLKEADTDIIDNYMDLLEGGDGILRDKVQEILSEEV